MGSAKSHGPILEVLQPFCGSYRSGRAIFGRAQSINLDAKLSIYTRRPQTRLQTVSGADSAMIEVFAEQCEDCYKWRASTTTLDSRFEYSLDLALEALSHVRCEAERRPCVVTEGSLGIVTCQELI